MSASDNSRIELDSSGSSLSYRDEGQKGDESLLLLHGLNAHSGTWRDNLVFLSKEARVIAPSLPPWRGAIKELDISHYVRYIEELVSKLGLRRIVIAGNSMGGWIGDEDGCKSSGDRGRFDPEDSAGVSSPEKNELLSKVDSSGVPLLIIWGEDDKVIPVDAGRYLHSRIKTSSLVVLKSTGHVPHWERADEFNVLVSDFLKKVRENRSR